MTVDDPNADEFPVSGGILIGLGFGGFFDGIVLHQLLQWHHMLSTWYPIKDLESLKLNTFWDGLFHSTTYVFVTIGLFVVWHSANRRRHVWSIKLLIGTLLLGWGAFNTVEGLVDHELLGVHHVNENYTGVTRVAFDMGFLAWGVAMLIVGFILLRQGRRERAVAQ